MLLLRGYRRGFRFRGEKLLQPLGIPDKLDIPVCKADESAAGEGRLLLRQHGHFLRVLFQRFRTQRVVDELAEIDFAGVEVLGRQLFKLLRPFGMLHHIFHRSQDDSPHMSGAS